MLRQVLLLGFVLVSVLKTTEGYCSQYAIQDCLEPLTKHPYNEGTFFPTKTKSEMKEVCGRFYKANECIKPYLSSCSLILKKTMEGLTNVYNFICKESLNEYLKYRECFANPTLNLQGRQCNATAQAKLRELLWKKYSMSNSEKKSEACGIMDYYVNCVHDLTKKLCGKGAAGWMDKVLRKAVGPIMSTTGCGGTVNSSVIVVAVGVGIAVLVALAVCVIYIYRRNKRSRVPYATAPNSTDHNATSYPVNQPQYATYPGQQTYPGTMYNAPVGNYPQPGYVGHQGAPPAYTTAVTGDVHTDKTPLSM